MADIEDSETIDKFSTSEVGSAGLRQSSGIIDEEFLPQLKGKKAQKAFREMGDNDPICGAVLYAITMLIRQAKWYFQAADESDKAIEYKEIAEQILFQDMQFSWPQTVCEIVTMLQYGFAPMEPVLKKRNGWKRDVNTSSKFNDGYFGLSKFSLRAQDSVESWDIDDNGNINGLVQQPYTGPRIDLPADNFILYRTNTIKNNPEGRSILRTAYRPWFFKKRLEETEAIRAEREATGFPVLYVEDSLLAKDATAQQKASAASYATLVKNVRRDKTDGAILPAKRDDNGNRIVELILLSTQGSSASFDSDKSITRYAREIAMSVLADFLFLGQSANGSFALSSDKTALFSTAVSAILGDVKDTTNNELISELWRSNGFDMDLMPELCHGDVETIPLEMICKLIDTMVGAGVTLFPDRELEDRLRELAGLPKSPPDFTDEEHSQIRRDDVLYGKTQEEMDRADAQADEQARAAADKMKTAAAMNPVAATKPGGQAPKANAVAKPKKAPKA